MQDPNHSVKINYEEIVDSQFEAFNEGRIKPSLTVISFLKGLYYLTFAKFTNPHAHAMAWTVIEKLRQEPDSVKPWTSAGNSSDDESGSAGGPITTVSAPES